MLMAASLEKTTAEADWKATAGETIMIDFQTSKLEMKTVYTAGDSNVLEVDFIDSNAFDIMGVKISMGDANNSPHWFYIGCMHTQQSLPDGILDDPLPQTWRIWKRNGKLNLSLMKETEIEIVKDGEPGDTEGTTCGMEGSMANKDWDSHWKADVRYVAIAGTQSYRIVKDSEDGEDSEDSEDSEDGEDGDESEDRRNWNSSTQICLNSWILAPALVACLPLWRY